MARCWLVLSLVAACAIEEPETNETTQASTSGQGTSAQGTSAQGTSAQGTSAQGTSAQGTTSGGASVSDAKVVGTQLQFWRSSGANWLQYTPTKICLWNNFRTIRLSCTTYDLATQPSPLAGTRWPMTFLRKNADGTTTRLHMKVQIGLSSTHVGAVSTDKTTTAFFDLKNSGATGAIVGCSNPNGCRRNTDLYLYDVKVVDFDDTLGALCPSGERAIALAGTWDSTATYHSSSTQFTFACTNGTIAKCTRWGYRRWASAVQANDPEQKLEPLAGYHQACVKAAMADYCGNGHSFTKNGTLIELFDYSGSNKGFIPFTGDSIGNNFTAAALEGYFDQLGGYWIDHRRYEELEAADPDWDIDSVCPGRFITGTWVADYAREGLPTYPLLSVMSSPACAHTELMVGKWLGPGCSRCTSSETGPVPAYCNDPTQSWDAGCVSAALKCAPADRMSSTHSECTPGAGLHQYTSGCTLAMSMKGYASCFNEANATAWTTSCVAAANRICTGGQEHLGLGGTSYGFCNQQIPLDNVLSLAP
jgi:hypothetical protein